MAEATSFRGYWAIKEVLERMDPLVEWTKRFKAHQRHITLARKDYDLIRRWPKAAHVHQIECVGPETWYHGFELTYDGGPRRYVAAAQAIQTDVEEMIMRDPILVRCQHAGFVDGAIRDVETISGNALLGIGLYLMIPVQNEKMADELAKQIHAKAA